MMSLHRAIYRGCGDFFDWMTTLAPTSTTEALTNVRLEDASQSPRVNLRPLPCVDTLDIADKAYVAEIINEALPRDRVRWESYLRSVKANVILITAVSVLST